MGHEGGADQLHMAPFHRVFDSSYPVPAKSIYATKDHINNNQVQGLLRSQCFLWTDCKAISFLPNTDIDLISW